MKLISLGLSCHQSCPQVDRGVISATTSPFISSLISDPAIATPNIEQFVAP